MVTVRIPVPSGQAVTNVLGLFGLCAVVVGIGGLAGVWWAVLAAGVAAVGLAVLAQTVGVQQVSVPAAGDAPTRELKRVS